jgi:hypothetical protein
LQVRPGWQTSPGQQPWPTSPQAAHTPPRQSVYALVQPTPSPQQALPARPHWPPWQPPPAQVPCLVAHAEPFPTQTSEFWSQQPPPAHRLPGQQGWPGPPQIAQTPRRQARSLPPQVALLQQGCPAAPHGAHTPPEQPRPAPPQPLPAQQGCPDWPQATQEPLSHPAPGAVQRPPQQAWPAAPQPPQLPLPHWPKPGHVAPGLTQVSFRQQPPLQVPSSQHAWPGPPHSAHTLPRQAARWLQGVAVWQQGSPGLPQPAGLPEQEQPGARTAATAARTMTRASMRVMGPSEFGCQVPPAPARPSEHRVRV